MSLKFQYFPYSNGEKIISQDFSVYLFVLSVCFKTEVSEIENNYAQINILTNETGIAGKDKLNIWSTE